MRGVGKIIEEGEEQGKERHTMVEIAVNGASRKGKFSPCSLGVILPSCYEGEVTIGN